MKMLLHNTTIQYKVSEWSINLYAALLLMLLDWYDKKNSASKIRPVHSMQMFATFLQPCDSHVVIPVNDLVDNDTN